MNKSPVETCLKEKDASSLVEYASKAITAIYPIGIPSYKNRSSELFDYFEKNKISFLVFVYEDDFTVSGYDKYQFQYGQFVKIPLSIRKGIGRKRNFMQNWFENNGISKYFMIDDDYRSNSAFYRKEDNCISIPFIDGLKTLQYLFDLYEIGIACPSHEWSNKNYKWNSVLIQSCHLSGLYLINGDILKQHDCYFTCEDTYEDLELAIQASIKKVKWGRLAPIVIKVYSTCDDNSVIHVDRSDYAFTLYKMHPHCIVPKLVYDVHLKHEVIYPGRLQKAFSNTERSYDKELYQYALSHTLEEFKEHLMNGQ